MFKRHVQNFRVGGAAKKNRGRPIRRTTSGSKPNYRKTEEGAGMTEAGVRGA